MATVQIKDPNSSNQAEVTSDNELKVTTDSGTSSTTADQGAPNTSANAWPVKLTDGTNDNTNSVIGDTVALDVAPFDPPLEIRIDNSTPNRTITGKSKVLGASQTAAVWQISATDNIGFMSHTFYQDNDPAFDKIWADRNANLPPLAFENTYSVDFNNDAGSGTFAPDSPDLDFANNAAFSWSFWIKTTSAAAQMLIQKTSTAAGNNGISISLDSSGRVDLEWRATGTGDRIRVRTDSLGAINIRNGQWHNITVTKATGLAASTFKIYVDNVDQTLNVLNNTLTGATENANPLWVASSHSGGTPRYRGNIDELALWNVELTSSEVNEIWNNNNGVIDLQTASGQISANLVSWWRFGDGTFTAFPTIPDEQSSNNITLGSNLTAGNIETVVPP